MLPRSAFIQSNSLKRFMVVTVRFVMHVEYAAPAFNMFFKHYGNLIFEPTCKKSLAFVKSKTWCTEFSFFFFFWQWKNVFTSSEASNKYCHKVWLGTCTFTKIWANQIHKRENTVKRLYYMIKVLFASVFFWDLCNECFQWFFDFFSS